MSNDIFSGRSNEYRIQKLLLHNVEMNIKFILNINYVIKAVLYPREVIPAILDTCVIELDAIRVIGYLEHDSYNFVVRENHCGLD